jgi:quercetin dioxygenase-like cupin family protein
MNTRNWKLTLAGACVACALGLIALRVASATPPKDIAFTPISGPAVLGDIATKSESVVNEVELKTKGLTDVYVTSITIKPGGYSGWHSHPGPSIISVKSGTLTLYDDCIDPTIPNVFTPGDAAVEHAGCVHNVVNEGDTDLVFVVVQMIPIGAPRLISEPEPLP